MVYNFINEQKRKKDDYSKTECFRMMGVSSTGYYNWVKKYEDHDGERAALEASDNEIREKFRLIIRKLGVVPGKRTFRTYMWRDYEIIISIKKCRRIMKSMNLVAKLPKRDAYKGQARHYHECVALQNKIQQEFKLGPRQIILTDITYLYYGLNRTVCYLCTFKDAYTNEILGYEVQASMTVGLIVCAYNKMMKKYGHQIKTKQCFLHSDQGSQYLSTEFQRILEDDEFIQSMSARGNSQDNAPMESFFGRLKTEVMDIIARCPSLETVSRLIDGYMKSYNTERYQYPIGGLTPEEYYQYCMTGIYPLDNYYGVEASELLTIEKIVELRMSKAKEKADRIKQSNQKKREQRAQVEPTKIFIRDQKLIRKEIQKYTLSRDIALNQLNKLNKIYEKTKTAVRFYTRSTKEVTEELKNPQNWKNYKELSYIYDIADLY